MVKKKRKAPKKSVEDHTKHKRGKKPGKKAKRVCKNLWTYLISIAAIIIIIAVVVSFSKGLSQGKTLATVNGEKITEKQIDRLYKTIPEDFQQYITKDQLLDQTINEVLLIQEAEKAGVTKNMKDAEDFIEQQLSMSGVSLSQFKESIEAQNIDYSEILELYRKQLLINSFLNETLYLDIQIDDVEITNFYLENRDFFTQEEEVRASHIIVETESEANSILNRINSGEDFAELASSYSIDSSAMFGGDLDFFPRGVMVQEFEDAAFNLGIGGVSPVVKTQFGYHIIKVTDKTPESFLILSEVRGDVESFLIQSRQEEIANEYIRELRASSAIIIAG